MPPHACCSLRVHRFARAAEATGSGITGRSAASIIFVATNTCLGKLVWTHDFVTTKHIVLFCFAFLFFVFCRDKGMFVAKKVLSRQKLYLRKFVAANTCLSRQLCVCHDKTLFYFFVATKVCLLRQNCA